MINAIKIRHGIAPWRGIIEVGVELDAFFLILAEPMFLRYRYFLNKLSKAARASLAFRGAGVFSTIRLGELGAA
jgi:hypothetical protein